MDIKLCQRCSEDKPLEDFYDAGYTRADGTRPKMTICKVCSAVKSREYYQANLESQRTKGREKARAARAADPEGVAQRAYASRVKGKYGITIDAVNEMWADQGGRCAICGAPEPPFAERHQRLHVDHDHQTGVVRGLLCSPCNQGLGYFSDDPDRLEEAAQYLRRPAAVTITDSVEDGKEVPADVPSS